METKHLTMAIRALRTFDHESAPDWADKAEDELKAFAALLDRFADYVLAQDGGTSHESELLMDEWRKMRKG